MLEQKDHKGLYREIVTNMLEGVMVISMNGKITMLNPAAERILAMQSEDIGNSFINVFLIREGTDAFNEVILDTIYEKEKVSNMPVDYMLAGNMRRQRMKRSGPMRPRACFSPICPTRSESLSMRCLA